MFPHPVPVRSLWQFGRGGKRAPRSPCSASAAGEQPVAPPVAWMDVGRQAVVEPFVLAQADLVATLGTDRGDEAAVGVDRVLRVGVEIGRAWCRERRDGMARLGAS